MKIQLSPPAGDIIKDLLAKNNDKQLPKNIQNLLINDLIINQKSENWENLVTKYIPDLVIVSEAMKDEEIKDLILTLIKKKKKISVA